MIERIVHGPIEFLAPDTDLNGILEISGIALPEGVSCTTHVFLDEVSKEALEARTRNERYAGSFMLPQDAVQTSDGRFSVQLVITDALRAAEKAMPNFHITFLTEAGSAPEDKPLFHYESVHIHHRVPGQTDLNISADVTTGLATDRRKPA